MPTIYTKTGDKGETGLGNGRRVSKDDARIEAIGAVDEVNAMLGVVHSFRQRRTNLWLAKFKIDEWLQAIQNDLFIAGAVMSQAKRAEKIEGKLSVEFLERAIDALTTELPPLANFVLPGGSEAGAMAHVARAVSRRAERRVVALMKAENDRSLEPVVVYLNRLSDFLFALARWTNQKEGAEEEKWVP